MVKLYRILLILLLVTAGIPAVAQDAVRYPDWHDLSANERVDYNTNPAKILPDAQAAFQKGEYGRTLMLCSMHWVVYGDVTADARARDELDAKSKRCYDLSREMMAFISSSNIAEAKMRAQQILERNQDDAAARKALKMPAPQQPHPADTAAAASPKPVKTAAQPVAPQVTRPEPRSRNGAVLIAPAVGFIPELSYGLMAGYVGKFGFYGKFRSNFVNTGATYACTSNGMSGSDYVWTSGKTKTSSLSLTFGALIPTGKTLIPYVGAGFAKRELAWEDVDGAWARVKDASVSSIGLEAGLLLRFGRFGLHIGVNTAGFKHLGADAGIALFF